MFRKVLSDSSAPPPVPSEATVNCVLMSLITLFQAETNWLTAVEAWLISGVNVRLTVTPVPRQPS